MNDAAVTLPQVLLMSRVERFGSASLSNLAEGSTTSLAALSQIIERLVQQGLLSRAEDAIDRGGPTDAPGVRSLAQTKGCTVGRLRARPRLGKPGTSAAASERD
jgi:hypothetical protein